jgi:hypothetical protein
MALGGVVEDTSRRPCSTASDQHSRPEDKETSHDDLQNAHSEARLKVAVTDPGNHKKLDTDHEVCKRQGLAYIRKQKRQRMEKSP